MINNEITDFELFKSKKQLEFLKGFSDIDITLENEEKILSALEHLFIYYGYLKCHDNFDTIHRITINKRILGTNKRIKDIRNLKYPPNKELIKKYGRCNMPKQSILYASFIKIISLAELRPKKGDLVTKSIWKLKSDSPQLTYIPIFLKQPTNKPFINPYNGEYIEKLTNFRTLDYEKIFLEECDKLPKNLRELSYFVVEFIAEFFAKVINRDNHLNYIFSAYFSNKFLNVVENGDIDAIIYPSVQAKLNFENIAIKPTIFDNLYRLSEVTESIVTKDLSDGKPGYFMQATSTCKDFNHDSNEIFWDYEKNKHFNDSISKLIEEYNIDLN